MRRGAGGQPARPPLGSVRSLSPRHSGADHGAVTTALSTRSRRPEDWRAVRGATMVMTSSHGRASIRVPAGRCAFISSGNKLERWLALCRRERCRAAARTRGEMLERKTLRADPRSVPGSSIHGSGTCRCRRRMVHLDTAALPWCTCPQFDFECVRGNFPLVQSSHSSPSEPEPEPASVGLPPADHAT